MKGFQNGQHDQEMLWQELFGGTDEGIAMNIWPEGQLEPQEHFSQPGETGDMASGFTQKDPANTISQEHFGHPGGNIVTPLQSTHPEFPHTGLQARIDGTCTSIVTADCDTFSPQPQQVESSPSPTIYPVAGDFTAGGSDLDGLLMDPAMIKSTISENAAELGEEYTLTDVQPGISNVDQPVPIPSTSAATHTSGDQFANHASLPRHLYPLALQQLLQQQTPPGYISPYGEAGQAPNDCNTRISPQSQTSRRPHPAHVPSHGQIYQAPHQAFNGSRVIPLQPHQPQQSHLADVPLLEQCHQAPHQAFNEFGGIHLNFQQIQQPRLAYPPSQDYACHVPKRAYNGLNVVPPQFQPSQQPHMAYNPPHDQAHHTRPQVYDSTSGMPPQRQPFQQLHLTHVAPNGQFHQAPYRAFDVCSVMPPISLPSQQPYMACIPPYGQARLAPHKIHTEIRAVFPQPQSFRQLVQYTPMVPAQTPALNEVPLHMQIAPDPDGTLSCRICGQTYWLRENLVGHIVSIHGQRGDAERSFHLYRSLDKQYICIACGLKTPGSAGMATHLRHIHGVLPYGCSQCGITLSTPTARKRHLQTCAPLEKPSKPTESSTDDSSDRAIKAAILTVEV